MLKDQDCDRWQQQYNEFRNKYLTVLRDLEIKNDSWAKEREEYQAMIEEQKLAAQLQAEPKELRNKQNKDYLREKNDDLVDTLVKQERICEKYKWELKQTGEALQNESKRYDKLRKENLQMKHYIQANYIDRDER